MDYPTSSTELELNELVRRAKAGEKVVLTENGTPVARIEPILATTPQKSRRAVLDAYRGAAKPFWNDDDSAARSQDFLYDQFGLPK